MPERCSISLSIQADDKVTHTSCFASIFFAFFDFRFSTFTFTHCASTLWSSCSLSGALITVSETRGFFFGFFDWEGAGADEGEEGRFIVAVAVLDFGSFIIRSREFDSGCMRLVDQIRSIHLPWAVVTLTPTLTIQNVTFPLEPNGSKASPATASGTSPVVTFRTSTSPPSSSPID